MLSVILPTHNRCQMACRAARSILTQRLQNFELIVIDDGSTEDMSELRELLATVGARYQRTVHSGVAQARNYGVSLASGRWLAFLDSDDVWLPDKLQAQQDYFLAHSQVRICQCKEQWIRNGRFVNPRDIHRMPNGEAFRQSLELCCISPSSVAMERSLFDQVGGFDPAMRVCEDYDLWLRITSTEPVGLIEEVLVCKYGGHSDQLSRSEPAIDRFRVYSLVKLLADGLLQREQVILTLAALERKSEILLSGARKRGNQRYLQLFAELCSHVRNCRVDESGEPQSFIAFLPELRRVIEDSEELQRGGSYA